MKPKLSPTTGKEASSERILLVDILRGFALLGIIINHISSGFLAGPPPAGNEQYNIFSPLDGSLMFGSNILTFGKFFTIFSFLFGLSFAIQLESAARKEGSFTLRFLWRLMILFVIGFVHNMFYSGDILVIYAILGLLLVPARFLSNRIVVPLALLLVLNVPGLVQDVIRVTGPAPDAAALEQQAAAVKAFKTISQEQFRIKQAGTLREVIEMNAIGALLMKFQFQMMTGRLWITFGLFLLGMYAGRKKVFAFNEANRKYFRRLLLWSGIATVAATATALLYSSFMAPATTLAHVAGNFAFSVHQATLSAFYVSGVVLLYWKAKGGGKWNYLAPVGQMGLSIYLAQSVFGLAVFYGFGLGLLGKIGVTASIALGVAFFFVQIIFARWWMGHFRYGLVEWAWRSLTYFKMQPMQRRQVQNTMGSPAPTPSVLVLESKSEPAT